MLFKKSYLQTLPLLLVLFAAAGACSPRLRRKYHEMRQREEEMARTGRGEELMDPPIEDIGERLIRAPQSQTDSFPPGAMRVQDIDPSTLAAQLATSSDMTKFNPTPYEVGSPEYNMAMINLLLSLKEQGHNVREVETNQPLPELYRDQHQPGGKDPLVCKTVPYNICYRMDKHGNLHPIGDRRPVRLLRVYKRK
ncbi:hypothetical protein TCAL_07118 [Tigriopus californicus]|uniref:Uncharacterized protein n=1 Tax=Tigriopus californicus TaxID=6832 RepID=A0A553PAT8_TIGCA|nr:uncharacterized protein LOC131892712 [Tigriopus californicus]TRY74796.1 hypothetical protein TCAL_07118 [Tigriopus californicus]|eukprot:TCALIF_07118-PA protein Name:"Protein of unknown function" AED:0.00 eAED:0.00 QI:194/1/1/1/0.66/0.75/4/580/194